MRYVLVPGAGGSAWYWHRVTALLEAAGHEAVAVDLPGDDEKSGLPEYADLVVKAAGAHEGGAHEDGAHEDGAHEDGAHEDGVVLVASSLAGFTAPLVCERIAVRALVFVNSMIPVSGETAGDWWGNVDSLTAREQAADEGGYGREFDLATYFLHDVAPDVAVAGEPYQRPEADIAFSQVCSFTAWPRVPIRVLAGADDRFFPAEFQRRVARERLGVEADVLTGGHLIAISNSSGVAKYLLDVR